MKQSIIFLSLSEKNVKEIVVNSEYENVFSCISIPCFLAQMYELNYSNIFGEKQNIWSVCGETCRDENYIF